MSCIAQARLDLSHKSPPSLQAPKAWKFLHLCASVLLPSREEDFEWISAQSASLYQLTVLFLFYLRETYSHENPSTSTPKSPFSVPSASHFRVSFGRAVIALHNSAIAAWELGQPSAQRKRSVNGLPDQPPGVWRRFEEGAVIC